MAFLDRSSRLSHDPGWMVVYAQDSKTFASVLNRHFPFDDIRACCWPVAVSVFCHVGVWSEFIWRVLIVHVDVPRCSGGIFPWSQWFRGINLNEQLCTWKLESAPNDPMAFSWRLCWWRCWFGEKSVPRSKPILFFVTAILVLGLIIGLGVAVNSQTYSVGWILAPGTLFAMLALGHWVLVCWTYGAVGAWLFSDYLCAWWFGNRTRAAFKFILPVHDGLACSVKFGLFLILALL